MCSSGHCKYPVRATVFRIHSNSQLEAQPSSDLTWIKDRVKLYRRVSSTSRDAEGASLCVTISRVTSLEGLVILTPFASRLPERKILRPSLCYAAPSLSPSFSTSELDESFFAVSLPVIVLIDASTTQSVHTGSLIKVKFTLSSASDSETPESRPRSALVRRVNHQNWAIVVFSSLSQDYSTFFRPYTPSPRTHNSLIVLTLYSQRKIDDSATSAMQGSPTPSAPQSVAMIESPAGGT
ncbi:hypothetical protein DFH08DRAFT_813674 [Mycena albidolilacea]|uniref:Uncharacterized protein n=1 Tax=Mycena albidolilacea TaxID=1033008 RepID=A0AAD7EM20_9AGAR|nr:hypothetical protein DFH08DRAFT_813674 [Mycena albidolilacea]